MACVTDAAISPFAAEIWKACDSIWKSSGMPAVGISNRIEQLVKNAFRPFLTDGNRRYGVLISLDDAKILELPAEHHLQGERDAKPPGR